MANTPQVPTNRLESFSDGVIAVAITLLVLDITVPPNPLGHNLLENWPHYAAYVTSFLTIGIIWINHHVMINRLRVADHSVLMLNLVLLMSVGVLPFATSLMAAYMRHASGRTVAALVYGGAFLAMAAAFGLLQRQILLRRPHLLKRELPIEERRQILRRSLGGIPVYVVATALALVSAYATLAVCAALAIYYAFPLASTPDRVSTP